MASPLGRRELERWAVVLLAALSAVPCLLWIAAGDVPPVAALRGQIFDLVIVADPRFAKFETHGLALRVLLGTVAVAGLLASATALAIGLRSYSVPAARLLAQACALGAASMGYFHFVRVFAPMPDLHPLARLAVDCVAVVMSAGAVTRFYQFLRNYPAKVALEAGASIDGMRYWTRITRVNAAVLSTMDVGLFGLLLIMAAIDVLGWKAGGHMLGFFSVLLAEVALIEGISATTFNARHALATGNRRHEWTFIGLWMALLLYLLAPLVEGATNVVRLLAGADLSLPAVTPVDRLLERAFLLIEAGINGFFAIVLMVLIMMSIFYHGTIDPRLAIRRGTVIGLLAAAAGLAFVVAERFVTALAVRGLGLSEEVGWIVAAAIAGVVVMPLRKLADRRIRDLVDRLSPPSDLADGEHVRAAIVFSDLSGFTALSVRDERSAVIAASLLHKTARDVASANRGRLVKTIGDAVVLEFAQSDDAVRATTDLHRKYAARALALELPALAVHSGIHAGEFLKARDGDIYGSTVNLAARLQDAAKPGEIVVSESVSSAATPGAFPWEALGERVFKNVPQPVNCHRLAIA